MTDIPTRMHYFDGQFLRTEDFVDEQAYHLGELRRHRIAEHEWGVAVGLDIVLDEGEQQLFVEPGVAVDGYGRELVVAQRRPLAAAFDERDTDVLEVWLQYDRVPAGGSPSGTACDESAFSRWIERPRIAVKVPEAELEEARKPPEASPAAVPAARPAPDDPAVLFPVYLGKLCRPDKADDPVKIDLSGRPYVGLVAESIDDPTGRYRLALGAESGSALTVYAPSPFDAATEVAVLDVDTVTGLEVRGDARVDGDLTVGGALSLPAAAPTEDRLPWHIYRHTEESGGEELRIALGAEPAGGRKGTQKLVIGWWGTVTTPEGEEKPDFVAAFTVSDDGTVTVKGDLIVGGSVSAKQGEAAPELGPRARELAVAGMLSGIAAGPGLAQARQATPKASADDPRTQSG